ncbi:hypothetical protein BGX29_004656, partial [Mortierella sp. GBA35]
MFSAVDRFFSIPRLAAMVAQFLGNKVLSSYIHANLPITALPLYTLLFHTIDFLECFRLRKLLQTLEYPQAFKRNIQFVRNISLEHTYLDFNHPTSSATDAISSDSSLPSQTDTIATDT